MELSPDAMAQPPVMAVSYTHLDVYKRQGKNLVNGIMIFADCFLSKIRRNNLQIHEDVYKRHT